jgi:DNA-directed RNA polymerase specialized sigma24 family protein
VDHARERAAGKRDQRHWHFLAAHDAPQAGDDPEVAARLSEALGGLAQRDPPLAELAELAWLAGMENDAIARLTGLHLRQVQRDLQRAKAWVIASMSP